MSQETSTFNNPQSKRSKKVTTERQPLLGTSESENEPSHTIPPRAVVRNSPENIVVDTQSESEIVGKSLNDEYDPALHRTLEHPTSNMDTLIHLLKGNIGTGILAMPDAFKNAGLYVGLFGTMIMGFICTHCMHMLVHCGHVLCQRLKVPSLAFPDVCYYAFETGPVGLRRYSDLARTIINIFLCITQIGFCCVYFVFVAVNLQEVVAHYYVKLDIRIYLILTLIPMIVLNLVKNLKFLTPISLIASVLTVFGIGITFLYMLKDLPHTTSVNGFASWSTLPLYFGTAIYAFEGIGVVLPLENNMKTPQAFGGLTGVLNTGMVIVTCLYTGVGFFGYLKYGDKVAGSITLNLPPNDILAQSVRLMMAIAIFFSYGLQFYVPINILGPFVKNSLSSEQSQKVGDVVLRIVLVIFTFILAAIIPNLGPIISLVGAVSSSTLALIFPPLVEIITFWPNDLGRYNWILWKDFCVMIFGILGFIFGTYASVGQILNPPAE